ncbi:MAG TPA: ABC transporter ATP-binding protein [Polyangiaceae bacterium]
MTRPRALHIDVKAHVGRLDIEVCLELDGSPTVLVGPNGSGKTSLLLLLLGVLRSTHGRITLDDVTLLDRSKGIDVPLEQRGLGYLPQDYALFPGRTARANVEFAIGSARPREGRRSLAERAEAILAELGLLGRVDVRVENLSGGERQRVALARAISVNPRALLLDEPLAALDVSSRRDVRGFLAEYLHKLCLPTLVVTHDPADARQLGHRIVVMESGRITQLGTWDDLRTNPASAFVEEFIGRVPRSMDFSHARA